MAASVPHPSSIPAATSSSYGFSYRTWRFS
jgi:hypothetical protein